MRERGRAWIYTLLLMPVLFAGGFLGAEGYARLMRTSPTLLNMNFSREALDPTDAFRSALAEVEAHYYGTPPAVDKLTYTSIDGMLGAIGDPYTRFMDPDAFRRMQEDTTGSFTGIGALLEDAPGGARIVRPLPNSPAVKAGLKPGDIIVAVDGKSLERIALDDAVRLIRGPRFTDVKLTIRRDGTEEPFTVTIRRDIVESPTVDVYLEDDKNKIYRIWLQNFSEKAPAMLDRALNEIKQNSGRAIILDLRANPGGLLESSIEVASRFISGEQVVVSVVGRQGLLERRYTLRGRFRNLEMPVVVLINGGSASASEIVAGALRDHKVASLIGEDSFGKGLVQTVIPTSSNTAVAITTAKYLTPNGTDLNAKVVDGKRVGGLKPDIEVKNPDDWRMTEEDRARDAQLHKALEVLREKLHATKHGNGVLRAQTDAEVNR
ncbi:MAG: peptidase S41 [Fimbriimonadales bacterium]|nr:MAG: peptidase S41 [Fimbriimonadales bacterium]GIV08756.1 MAG: peptidase S41 [Fimbriimonadales bacterium]